MSRLSFYFFHHSTFHFKIIAYKSLKIYTIFNIKLLFLNILSFFKDYFAIFLISIDKTGKFLYNVNMEYRKANIFYNKKTYSIIQNDDPEFFTHLISANILMHTHSYWEGFYVVRGACSHISGSSVGKLLPGTLYLLKPYVEHSFADKDEKDLFLHRDFCIGDSLLKECCDNIDPNLYEKFILSPKKIFSLDIDKHEQSFLEKRLDAFNIARDGITRASLAKLFVDTLLQLFVENDMNINPKYDETFSRLLILLKNKDVLYEGIPKLIELSGYSHGHICRLFKQYTGQSPVKILTDLRMQQAETMLTQTDFPIIYISNEIGYPSMSRFISLFKRYYNMTPYQYRKNTKLVEK